MSTSSSIQGSSTYSNSNSPTEQQQQQMALGFNQFFDQQQKLDQLPALSLPAAPPSSIQNAQLQLLEALAKAGLLPPIPAAAGQKEDEIAQQLLNGFTKDSNNNNAKMNLSDVQQPPTQRKRRRLIGNLDNTLDGLVAKRVDQTPLKRRYQTETEAIELPDDEVEIKRMEADPDVCTRMCSVCGYQGKWVSEMIRHKRVHTNDRPFKCKYCNRTSKWKADLIRHVAKTHGIRVVSKYSRSKAFEVGKPAAAAQPTEDDVIVLNDNFSAAGNFSSSASECGSDQQHQHSHSHSSSAQSMASFEDENNNNNNNTGIGISKGGKKYADSFDHLNSVQRKAQRLNSISRPSQQQQQKKGGGGGEQGKAQQAQDMLSQLLAFPGNLAAAAALQVQQQKAAQQNVYKCGSCIYEQSSFPVLVSHLLSAHRLSPFFCQLCSRPFNELVTAGEHFAAGQCPPLALKANFVVKAAANGKLQQQQQQQMTTPSLGQFGPLIAAQRPGMPNSLDQLLAASLLPTSSSAAFNNKATFPALFNPPPSMVGGGGLFPTSTLFPSAGAGFPASLFNPTSLGNSCCSPDSVLSSFGSLNSLVNFDKQSKMEKLAKTDGESKEEEEEEEKHGLEEEQEEEENKSQSASVDLNLLMSAKHLSPAHSPVESVTATANQQTKEEEADETEKDPATAAARLLLKAIQQQLAAGANSKSCGSAFTPVNNAMKPAAKPQQQDCPASATAASLAAFGQFLAELQSRTSSQQQQQATTATMFH